MPEIQQTETDFYQRTREYITIRGARQHNLKNIDVDLPKNKLIVITGPSGSGKSSLAFDTIYAEGQRRYVESMSSYARQFLERMDKPDVDVIMGLAPAIAIEQKTLSKNPRSTVATQTEIYDHLRILFTQIGKTISPVSGRVVTNDSPRSVLQELQDRLPDGARFQVCFPFPHRKFVRVEEQCKILLQRGFFRIVTLPGLDIIDLNETDGNEIRLEVSQMLVLADRLRIRLGDTANESRIADSVYHTFREGKGKCVVITENGELLRYSEQFERDGMVFPEPTARMFSFNNPLGACRECQGFGRVAGIDKNLVIPNPILSIRQGAIAPFRTGKWSEYLLPILRIAESEGINIDCAYQDLPEEHKKVLWDGKENMPGIWGFFDMLEASIYKMHYRIFRARFRGYTPCPSCQGYRLSKEALYVQVGGLHIGQVMEMTTRQAGEFFDNLTLTSYEREVTELLLDEIRKRLRFLVEVGLGYLTLDRQSNTLSGGESQRINLATSLGSSLVGSLYVLDEPTIGLHPRDTGRLVGILEHLRDIGNTVIVVEHEAEVMRRADQIVDIGPKAGQYGGNLIFQGSYADICQDYSSLTGAYLGKRKQIAIPPQRRPLSDRHSLMIQNAREHNLKNVTVRIPLGMVVCITGVSGSGKSTLVHDTLYQAMRRLKGEWTMEATVGKHDIIHGHKLVDAIEMVDQKPIGRSPRSNPVTYTKAFDAIRQLMSSTYHARMRQYGPGHFSFNVESGRCDACQGEGFVKIDMQFLADIYLGCEVCKGKRYKKDILEIRYRGKNIHDILCMTIEESLEFFKDISTITRRLQVLNDIGLGYLTLGQPATTLSGGEAQRIKLGAHMCSRTRKKMLYLFDEPTTGLHFDDIRKLLAAFNQLVDNGHSVIVIEHNLDVIKSADWVIDLGPEGGEKGGYVVAEGTPEHIATSSVSHTGYFLRQVLNN